MGIAGSIRRQIFYHTENNKLFSVRDFFKYGTRTAVYQEFYRLVKAERIKRVTYGLYMKANANSVPSLEEVVKTKAAAFKKTIAIHGAQAAHALELTRQAPPKHIFAVRGSSSSFRFGGKVIYLRGTCARKMHLGDDLVGLAIRALWHIGHDACDIYAASKAVRSFRRHHRQQLRANKDLMPHWMQKCFDYFDHPRRA